MLPREIPPFFDFWHETQTASNGSGSEVRENGVAWAVGRAVCDYLFGQLMFHRAWAPGLSMAVKMETIGERFLPSESPELVPVWEWAGARRV